MATKISPIQYQSSPKGSVSYNNANGISNNSYPQFFKIYDRPDFGAKPFYRVKPHSSIDGQNDLDLCANTNHVDLSSNVVGESVVTYRQNKNPNKFQICKGCWLPTINGCSWNPACTHTWFMP